jgi:hypothetical protein
LAFQNFDDFYGLVGVFADDAYYLTLGSLINEGICLFAATHPDPTTLTLSIRPSPQ